MVLYGSPATVQALESPCLLNWGLLNAFSNTCNISLDTHGSIRRKNDWLAACVGHTAQDEDLSGFVWQSCTAPKSLSAL